IADSGFIGIADPDRVGVIWASGIGGLLTFQQEVTEFVKGDGTPRFSPFFIPKMIPDIASGHISIKHCLRGPNYCTTSACASAASAFGDSFNHIRLGKADVMVTGGSEMPITEASIGGFNAMHALSTRNDDFATGSRPFDKDRDGFVPGEGSGAIILEELQHALARGAKIYAEVGGCGMSADAHHITSPHPDGYGAFLCMKHAVEEAGLDITDVDHINTHGTSTPAGDLAEPKAIVNLFKDHAYKIAINSTKSMTGHLLGAA
ncbi:MAG: beta-ketoacyl synthase N-terminal-like domain-containing protein, partial [Bacteroidales bacterium]|nr:beta-ketoacyl synthase N-terminal-like domain-containing protein [Bacteroidales bacterium]